MLKHRHIDGICWLILGLSLLLALLFGVAAACGLTRQELREMIELNLEETV